MVLPDDLHITIINQTASLLINITIGIVINRMLNICWWLLMHLHLQLYLLLF